MIYCNLKGGLGNMLFQIAATIEYSRKLNVDFSFPNLSSHKRLFDNKKVIKEYDRIFNNFKDSQPPQGIRKISFPFHYVGWDIPKECIIDGFFQSEKYFKESRSVLMNLFNNKARQQIDKVSVHVRRGDYVKKTKFHNLLTMQYYNKSFSLFPKSKFLFFSDDLEWCKENFIGDRYFFHESEGDLNDLEIMSSCQHNIVANSSFSWWAAWLNRNEDKKVVCPSQWVGPALSHLDTRDIYCENWIKI